MRTRETVQPSLPAHDARDSARRGLVLILAAGVLWGTDGPCARLVHQRIGASPLDLAAYRGGLATLALWAVLRARPRIEARSDWARAAVLGLARATTQVCYFAAVQQAGVTVATLVMFGLAPVFVAAGETVILREPPRPTVLVAMATSILGLALFVGGGEPSLGAAFALLGGLLYAGWTLASRSMTRRIPNTDLNLVISAAGTIVLLPLAIAQGLTLPDNAATGAIILYFGLAGTVAFGLQLGGLRRVTATETAVAAVLEPLVAAVLAAVLFDERLGVVAIVGGILMLGSIAALFSPKAARDGSTSTPGDRSVAP